MNGNNSNVNLENQYTTKKASTLSAVDPLSLPGVEEWVVNSVKLSLVKKLDSCLDSTGRENLRKLLLVPIFTIQELSARVKETAPEMKTLFYKELSNQILFAEKRFS